MRMPVVFFGHGSPMNTLARNRYTEAWRRLGASVPRPKAILCVSAHWYTHGTAVTAMERPETIHDFYGFPQALFDVQYPAPGDPALAARVGDLLAAIDVQLDELGAGSRRLVGAGARVPRREHPGGAAQHGRRAAAALPLRRRPRLAPLRDEGVLVVGSGNVVHNLRAIRRGADTSPYDWAVRFNERVRAALAARDHEALIKYEAGGADAALSIPTPEHYLPLLYVAALQAPDEEMSIAVDGIEMGSLGMLTAVTGRA